MIAELAKQPGLARRLRRLAADAANANQRLAASGIRAAQLFGSKLQHRLEKTVVRITNGKLRSVHADRHTARPGSRIIAQQGALTPLIQLALGVDRKSTRLNSSHL